MRARSLATLIGLAAIPAVLIAGCAGTPGLSTASVTKPEAKPVVDPACSVLRARIAQLTASDSTVSRLEKAADGQTKSVMVKRSALAAAAELNEANASYRARCSNPELLKAAVQPAQTAAATTSAVKATTAQTAETAKVAADATKAVAN